MVVLCLIGFLAACGATAKKDAAEHETDWKGDPVWRETAASLPEYPRREDLLPLAVESRNEYFVDAKSLSRLSDGVVRYTVVIRSPTGAENVLHEGLRCETNQFKTYAYGVGGRFRAYQDPRWRRVLDRGVRGYTGALRETYACGEDGWPLQPKAILTRIRQGGWDAGTPAYDPK